ncbi:DUF7144 family membrane protein [Thermofilum pendens]|uniref:DUF7144 domain-containing protein n=1 Tax=Thermofilum pendens (strain DSM 2475 / Hrk 5) TaxID=368408 RepID=A1S023_THEPD|nr:hypothetical protein [Thermofilum pendens]ABL78803.1 conserved hypothetical protein [Thermofilum pendens Hrk 5]
MVNGAEVPPLNPVLQFSQTTRTRPTGVTILAVLNMLGGALLVLLGLIFVAVGPLLERSTPATMPGLFSLILGGLGALLIVMGAVSLIVGWGLWTGKGWAWWVTVIFEVLGLLSGLLSAAAGDPFSVVGLLVSAIVLWYMFKPHVKDFFGVKVGFST